MKRFTAFFLAALFLLSVLAACAPQEDPATTEEETSHPDYGFDLSAYIRLPDLDTLRAEYADPTVCTEEEIDEAVFQVMLTYAVFEPLTEDREIRLYDRVTLAYYGYVDGEVVDDLVETDAAVVVGKQSDVLAEVVLGDVLIGKRKGDSVSAEYTYPDDVYYYGSLSGKTVQFEATIYSVEEGTVPPCDDEFVRSFEEYAFDSVEEFRAEVRATILQQKEGDKVTAVWNAYLRGVEYLDYPQGAIDWYCAAYEEECLSTAALYDKTVDEFLSEFLQLTREEFEEQKKQYAQNCVENDLAVIQLGRALGVTLTDEEFREGAERYLASSGEDLNVDEYIRKHSEYMIRLYLEGDKALNLLVEKVDSNAAAAETAETATSEESAP